MVASRPRRCISPPSRPSDTCTTARPIFGGNLDTHPPPRPTSRTPRRDARVLALEKVVIGGATRYRRWTVRPSARVGWSSSVAPFSIAGECLPRTALDDRDVVDPASAFEREPVLPPPGICGTGTRGTGHAGPGPETPRTRATRRPETPGHSENFARLFWRGRRAFAVGKTNPDSPSRADRDGVDVDLADRDGAPPPTIPELVAAHEIARVVQACRRRGRRSRDERTTRRAPGGARQLRLTGDETIVDARRTSGRNVTRPTTPTAATRRRSR